MEAHGTATISFKSNHSGLESSKLGHTPENSRELAVIPQVKREYSGTREASEQSFSARGDCLGKVQEGGSQCLWGRRVDSTNTFRTTKSVHTANLNAQFKYFHCSNSIFIYSSCSWSDLHTQLDIDDITHRTVFKEKNMEAAGRP